MKNTKLFLGLILASLTCSLAFCATSQKDDEGGVKVNGIILNMAKDRKMEKVGGIYEPEGVDKYVERKMNEMAERMQRIELQIEDTNKKIDKLSSQLSSAAATAATSSKDNHSK